MFWQDRQDEQDVCHSYLVDHVNPVHSPPRPALKGIVLTVATQHRSSAEALRAHLLRLFMPQSLGKIIRSSNLHGIATALS